MVKRKADISRKTGETDISVSINLDGDQDTEISTSIPFMDHMLELLSRHSGIGLQVNAQGDTAVDFHHTIEDTGICLGQALDKALGDKKGIQRFASVSVPMDECLAHVSLDISGRSFLVYSATETQEKVGTFDVNLIEEFFRAFVSTAKVNLHINVAYGTNAHHMIEAVFKGTALALRKAVRREGHRIPSTKGVL